MSDALAVLLGDNNPPPDLLVGDALREKLSDANGDLLHRRDALLEAAERVPTIDSDDVAGKVTDFIKQLAALHKAAEAKRTDAKEPYLEGGRNIDGFFKSITDPVSKAKVSVERRLTEYLRDKELSRTRGEYGSVSSLRTAWVFDEIDREAIDLEALRFHLPTDALEKAVRSFIKAGGRELRGTRIFETTAAVVR